MIADAHGQVLAVARGDGSNWMSEDVENPMAVVADTVREALRKAGIDGSEIEMGVFTLAGADWPEDLTRREENLFRAGICKRLTVKNDAFGGLRAGLTNPYGMVLAMGTGMNAAVITPTGQEWAFGYYETFGGAGSIAKQAFAALLRAEDGRGMPTELTALILARLEFPTVEAMLRAFVLQQVDTGRFYTITPLVFEAAFHRDIVATEILTRIGKDLAEYVTAMARRFDMCKLAFDVVLAGSVFKGVGPVLIDTLTQQIHYTVPLARIVRARYEPVVGSVLLTYDALRMPVSEEVYRRLAETAPGPVFFDTAEVVSPALLWEEEKNPQQNKRKRQALNGLK